MEQRYKVIKKTVTSLLYFRGLKNPDYLVDNPGLRTKIT